MTRLIAFDHGRRRIGVAVADTEVGVAFVRPAVRPARGEGIAALLERVRQEGAELAIVGLPRNMDGSEGPQAAAARSFADTLASAGLTVELVDERLTSWQVEQGLPPLDRRRARSRGEIDSAAARLILQDYLDRGRRPESLAPTRNSQESG